MLRSIKVRLILGLGSVIAVVLAAILVIVGFSFSSRQHESYRRSMTADIGQLDYGIGLFLENCLEDVDMLAQSPALDDLGGVTTSHLGTTAETSARVQAGDAAGRRIVDLMAVAQKAHPAYVEVYAGSEGGTFVSSLENATEPAGYDPRRRPWYTGSHLVTGRPVLGKAYLSTTGEAVTCVSRAVMRNGRLAGVVGIDISLKNLTGLVKSVRLGRTGYLVLVQDDGVILADARHPDLNFKKVSDVGSDALRTLFGMRGGSATVGMDGRKYLGVVVTSPVSGWKIMGFVEQAEINAPVVRILTRLAVVGLVSLLLLSLAVGFVVNSSILKPLGRVSAFVKGIAGGVYDRRISHHRGDEIGVIFDALNSTAETLQRGMKEIRAKTAEAEEKARLAAQATAEAEAARHRAECAMNEGKLAAAEKLDRIVGIVSSASSRLSAQIAESSKGAEKQAGRVAETATAMEEMSSTVVEVAKNAGHAAETSDSARGRAADGAAVVDEVVKGIGEVQRQTQVLKTDMGTLGKQVEGIGQVMNVISDIADQTNLLALNAAIEAARAGDAGRGFAVVADEVRKLAEKTMAATKEVGEALSGIQSGTAKNIALFDAAAKAVEHATGLSQKSGDALREIVGLVENSSDQVRSIATASEEQSAASEEINKSIGQVNAIAQETSKAMDEAARAVDELARQAGGLRDLVGALRREAGEK